MGQIDFTYIYANVDKCDVDHCYTLYLRVSFFKIGINNSNYINISAIKYELSH